MSFFYKFCIKFPDRFFQHQFSVILPVTVKGLNLCLLLRDKPLFEVVNARYGILRLITVKLNRSLRFLYNTEANGEDGKIKQWLSFCKLQT